MNAEAVAAARSAVLEAFRWNGGHADFSQVLRSPEVIRCVGAALAEPLRSMGVTAIVAPEARGFVVGALTAEALGVGLVLARKPGSVHPGAVEQRAAGFDWRGRQPTFRISSDAIRTGDRIALVDDWIETGTQARTIRALVTRLGAVMVATSVMIEGASAATRRELCVTGLVRASQLPPSE